TILKRPPYIELPKPIRPENIINSILEFHPHLNKKEEQKIRDSINRAVVMAQSAHNGVLRKSGEPYVNHPFSVAYILARMGMDRESVIAGILHDTVEDSTTKLEEIEEAFGENVTRLVDGLTKFKDISLQRNENQARTFQKLITFASDDIRTIIIKLIDRLHNMTTIDVMRPEKIERISNETLRYYAPLAHRFGIYWLKEELETYSFYYLFPKEWKKIDNFINKKYPNARKLIDHLKHKVKQTVLKNNEGTNLKLHSIYGRVKSYYSIYKKSIQKNKSIERLKDILGIRVIVDSEISQDCYLAMAAIHSDNEFTVINNRFKDYISRPKKNGYQSIHTGVRYKKHFMEIQIRTKYMERVAEEGKAAHWAYKTELSHKDKVISWLHEVLEHIENVDPLEYMNDIEHVIPLEKITVFTPKGDLITVPEKATLLDFAYAIHSELGNTCIGGIVNGKKVPIYFRLSNKDEAEIHVSTKQHPRKDWLNFVKTPKAKQNIRRYLKKKNREAAVRHGRMILKPLYEALGRKDDFNKIEKLNEFKQIADKHSLPAKNRKNRFFKRLSTGELKLRPIIRALFSKKELDLLCDKFPEKIATLFPAPATPSDKSKKGVETKKSSIEKSPLFIPGEGETRQYHIAKCCLPDEDDPIVAYISKNRGYVIHKKSCSTLKNINKDRILNDAFWFHSNSYQIDIIIKVKNHKGALFDIIKTISGNNIDIASIHLNAEDSEEKEGSIYLTVNEVNLKKLETVRKKLKKTTNIISFDYEAVDFI
ncbi:MAG: RelA/SpoT family protein, partial [bacterium]